MLIGAAAVVVLLVVLTAVALGELEADIPAGAAAAVALSVVSTTVTLPPTMTVRSSVADASRFMNTVT